MWKNGQYRKKKNIILTDFQLNTLFLIQYWTMAAPRIHLCTFDHKCQGSLTWTDKPFLIFIANFSQ